jgi:hypothetical protein
MGGHLGPQHWTPLNDAADCAWLNGRSRRRKVARACRPPDAVNAGYTLTPYVPGIGSHQTSTSSTALRRRAPGDGALRRHGQRATWSARVPRQGLRRRPTDGFAGKCSTTHVGLCVKGTMVISDSATSAEDCAAMGGVKADGRQVDGPRVGRPAARALGAFQRSEPHRRRTRSGVGSGEPCSGSNASTRYDLTPGLPADQSGTSRRSRRPPSAAEGHFVGILESPPRAGRSQA